MRKAFDWKRSRISMLEVEAVPLSCIPLRPDWFKYCFIHVISLLLAESCLTDGGEVVSLTRRSRSTLRKLFFLLLVLISVGS
jgi:hypothetical protein